MATKGQIRGNDKGQIMNDNIEATVKSSHKKTTISLEGGKSAITMNGGLLYPIMFKEILAGEYIENWKIDNITRLITPLVPTMDKVYFNVKAFFVPNTRIDKDWEMKFADKDEIDQAESYANKLIPAEIVNGDSTKWQNFKNTLAARYGIPNSAGDTNMNLLLPRGYRAIFNDYIRNKQYEPKKTEWNDTQITTAEKNALNPYTDKNKTKNQTRTSDAYVIEAAQTRKNYYTNIMKNIAKHDIDEIGGADDHNRGEHLEWQMKYQNMKQKAENANKNDWDIIAEMGGTSPIKTDRVEYLGEIDYELNYQQITQSSNEVNAATPLGTTGSFSFTRANGTIFQHKQFRQHGYIHILASIQVDTLFENGTPKELLKNSIDDIYRPALAKKEIQLMATKEISNTEGVLDRNTAAFQPAFAEYKRMPSFISGEMRTERLQGGTNITNGVTNSHWHNFLPLLTDMGQYHITGNHFRPAAMVNAILARNNILDYDIYSEWVSKGENEPTDDMIMNMSEHTIKTKLPIEEHDLKQKRKAEVSR